MKLLYATDMDRTMIFSHRFIDEYRPDCEYELAEEKDGREISYISKQVKAKLAEINNREDIFVVPVTTRSLEEFNRIELGCKTKYAIIDNGGTILEDGEPIKEWEEYVSKNTNKLEMLQVAMDFEDMKSVGRPSKYIDNKYVFNKTKDIKTYDIEVATIMTKYSQNFNIVRQKNKIYAVPRCFDKAMAIRWLQHRLGCDKVIASGDSELDLPMLAIADYAIVPEHGDLIKSGYVTEGRIANAGINSPLYTFDIIDELMKK